MLVYHPRPVFLRSHPRRFLLIHKLRRLHLPPPPSADHDVVMHVLRQKTFPNIVKPVFPLVSGFVPGFDARNPLSGRVHVLFIEHIEHELPEAAEPGVFISEANVDVAHYDRIFNTFPRSILRMGDNEKGKVPCLIVTWVSR